jgi:streptogramin lyase
VAAAWCATAAGATVQQFSAGIPAGAGPNVIATGQGAMWFTEYHADQIGRVDAGGSVTQYPTSGPGLSAGADPSGIVVGPDGNVWFTEYGTGRLGEINPLTGQLVGEYPLPSGSSSDPEGIIAGPDGALWFTERGVGQIGRLDLAAAMPGTSNGITEYPLGTSVPDRFSTQPVDLVIGSDDALWVTLFGTAAVDRVDTSAVSPGTLNGVTDYPLPGGGSIPEGITAAGGELWIADDATPGELESVNPAAVSPGTSSGIAEFQTSGKPLWVSGAADDGLWATDNTDDELLRFDATAHTTTVFGSGQGVTGDATSDAQDDAGNLWFTEFDADEVGEVSFPAGPGAPINTTLPVISGAGSVGMTAACATGTWAQSPTGYAYRWLLSGRPIAGQTAATYTVTAAAAGHPLTCQVTAANPSGSATAFSAATTPSGPVSETLTITTSGSGTGTVSGSATCFKFTAASSTCPDSFPYGTVVTLTAAPGTGSSFIGWLSPGDSNCVLGTCTIVMTGNESVTAYFETPQTLTTTVDGNGQGYVSDVPARAVPRGGSIPSICSKPPDTDRTCTKQYPFDAETGLRAVATEGSRFAGWTGACSGTGTCTVLMDAAQAVTATFTYDAGVHVNAIEVTQGIQTTELPTRTTAAGYAVSYAGVPILSNGIGSAPVTVKLAQDHATVVRVYVNTALPRRGQPIPTMRLSAYRDGQLLAPGPIGPDSPTAPQVPIGALGYVSPTTQLDRMTGAYTFTLPWGWAEGGVSFVADTNPDPGVFPSGCLDTDCLDRGIELSNVDFHPVSFAEIDPIAITVNGQGPKGFQTLRGPTLDPSWSAVGEVVPFPIYVGPYAAVINGDTAATTCDGVTQGKLTTAQFKQAVYAAQDTALLALVSTWASNHHQTSSSIIPYGLLSPTATSCAGSLNYFSGGISNGAPLYSSNQPQSVATDDRPLTGMAHEFHHDIGLQHAGVQCNSGSAGTAQADNGSTTSNSATLTLASTSGLSPGQPITGPGIPPGDETLTLAAGSVTMTLPATSTATGSYQFAVGGIGQVGSVWPPTFAASTGVPADGLLDGVGLVGLDDPANSPYTIRGPAIRGVKGHEFYDVMSYCASEADAWISVRNWNYDVGFHAPAPAVLGGDVARTFARAAVASSAPGAAEQPFVTRPPASMASARTLAVTSFYDINSGRAVNTSVTPDASAPTAGSPNATYTLAGRDAAGHQVTTAGTVTQLIHADAAPGVAASSIIMIQGKLPAADVRQVDVLQSGMPIVRDRASAHAPTAGFQRLRAGSRIGGPHGAVFHWRSHDADGGPLSVTLDYSANGGRSWSEIYGGADTGRAVLPGDLLTASRDARVRLYVSDGFNETIVTSPRFVSPGVPPQPVITAPSAKLRQSVNAAINLSGSAYDGARRLTGHALVWHAGRQLLGSGAQLTTTALTAGRHRVILTARAHGGRSGTATVTITVLPATPVLAVLRAPKRISAHAKSVTLQIATLAADTVTIGRLRRDVGRRARAIRITVKPGTKPLSLTLVLRSGRDTTKVPVAISR